MSRLRLVIITGLSGSGKTTAARVLEDEGFFVVDNLPFVLLPRFLEVTEREGRDNPRIAVVLDVRNRNFLAGWETILQGVRDAGHFVEIYFFDASEEYLIRRYSETRRRHPLVQEEGISTAIAREREMLTGLRRQATAVFDTSGINVHQLKQQVLTYLHGPEGRALPMAVHLQSFGFRYGIPPDSDLVFDVRFLHNPHFIDELRPLTGLDRAVSGYILKMPPCTEFLKHLRGLFGFLLPHYRKEGKSYLTVSIGCTGGRHRSVTIVEELRSSFAIEGVTLDVIHRDIAKG